MDVSAISSGSVPSLIYTIALVLGASWCAGINVYATVAVLGLLNRFVPAFSLPQSMEVLSSYYVIVPAVAMYIVEFVADKVPAVDTLWDSIHTFIRIPAGVVLAAASVGDVPMDVQVGAALIGGTLALGAHATKATTRLVAHGTGTSAVVSPTVSLVEDGIVVATIALVMAHPLIAIILIALMIFGAIWVLWCFWGVAKRAFRCLLRPRRCRPEEPQAVQTSSLT